ncbi:MAG: DUF3791 domain-containing protein [bacterium]
MSDSIETVIVPMKIKDLVCMIMERKGLDLESAIDYLYHTRLYSLLKNDKAKMWYDSSEALFAMLEDEKKTQSNNEKEILFAIYCLENYINDNQSDRVVDDALAIFAQKDVYDFLIRNYDALHTQDRDYIMETINIFINNKE